MLEFYCSVGVSFFLYTRDGDLCNSIKWVRGINTKSACQNNFFALIVNTTTHFRLLCEVWINSEFRSGVLRLVYAEVVLITTCCGAKECFLLFTKPLGATDFAWTDAKSIFLWSHNRCCSFAVQHLMAIKVTKGEFTYLQPSVVCFSIVC